MKTRLTNSILEMADKTKICMYCGKKIKVTQESSSNSHYWDDEWEEYECSCEDWTNFVKMNEELKELNYELYRTFCNYQEKRREISSKFEGNLQVGVPAHGLIEGKVV